MLLLWYRAAYEPHPLSGVLVPFSSLPSWSLRSGTHPCTAPPNSHLCARIQTLLHAFYEPLVCTPAVEGDIHGPQIMLDLQAQRRIYSYTSDENIFFAVTFSLSFLLGSPCAITGIF